MRRVLLIANPASRRGARTRDAALSAFGAAGVRCDPFVTERAGHAAELARGAGAEYEALFVLGGDGTAMEVLGALAGSGRPVGILPGGTGNLVARSLGVPRNVPRAVRALLAGDVADIDLGRTRSGRRFAFTAGVGVDATMIEHTPATLKRRLGVLAYVLAAARAVLRRETFLVRAMADGELIERQASAVMVANFGAVLDELIALGPRIRQDDGLLDLCIFSPRTLRDALRVTWRLFRKDFGTDECMLYRAGRSFRIETTPVRIAQADGELLGPTPLEIDVEPRAARLLVPARRSR